MGVVRREKNKNYTTMSNVHLFDKDISLKARGLLSTVLALPDNWGYSVNGLVALCKESETAVKSCMKELKDHGYLQITKERGEKGLFEYVYTFYEQPKTENPTVEHPEVENPPMENPTVEHPEVENIGLLNTKELNTNKSITNILNTDVVRGKTTKQQPPVITLLLETGEVFPIMQVDIEEFKKAYSSIDTLSELKKIGAWLSANPQKRRSAEQTKLLIIRWLTEEQKKAQQQQPQNTPRTKPQSKPNSFNNFPQRTLDIDQLEKSLLTRSAN